MQIINPSITTAGGVARASATLIWEQASRPPFTFFMDVEEKYEEWLTPDPNAFLMAALVPAWGAGEERIHIEGALCPLLCRNLKVVFAKLAAWFPADFGPPPRLEPTEGWVTSEPVGQSVSLLSCGIDSLATLYWNIRNIPRHHSRAIRAALYVSYDRESEPSLERLRQSTGARRKPVENIATDAGIDAVAVRSNGWWLASDGYFFDLKWHGAAFASAGAMMSKTFQRVYIAAGPDPAVDLPWGSHPMLDPYYSSAHLAVEHDTILTRLEKTRMVSEWQAGLDNLRICQNHTDGERNCGACEKCIRTSLMLLILGRLESEALPRELTPEMIGLLHEYEMISAVEGVIDYYEDILPQLFAMGRPDLGETLDQVLRETRLRHMRQAAERAPSK